MKNRFFALFALATIAAFLFIETACKREPVYIGELIGNDTTIIIPPIPVDTADLTGTPCSADSVYFQNSVLPLLVSNCALSGCHDAVSHEEGVILTDYQNVMSTGKVKAFKPQNSKLYTSLNAGGGDRMPPTPAAAFTAAQKAVIQKWIAQGALNNACNENYGQGCSTVGVTYTNFIQPLVANQCLGCHSTASTGGGILLKNYADIKASGLTGKFYGSVIWANGISAMPKNGAKMSDCYAEKVKAWIDSGMPQ